MSRSSREIKARFQREQHVFESDDLESRVVIADAQLIDRGQDGSTSLSKITVKGEAASGALVFGLDYRFFGRWFSHPVYGDQFHYESFVVDKPASRDAVINYLRQCKGFGSVRAGKLFDLHGETCIDLLIESPDRIANEIKGLTVEDARSAAVILAKSEHIRRAKLDVIEILHGKKFPRKLTDAVIKDHGSAAANEIRRNPYGLMQYKGCGFLKTDKLYCELGHNPKRLKRQALCAWHAIARVSEGDTWFPFNKAVKAIYDNVSGVETNRIDKAIKAAIMVDLLRVRTGEMGQKWIADARKADHEERVARLLVEAAVEYRDDPDSLMWPSVETLNVSDHQRAALRDALRGFVCNLAGSPGTGKTHCTAELIKLIMGSVGASHIAACAPSGKAAVRMTDALDRCGIPLRATTIHSLLVVESAENGWTFGYDERRPLPHKFIFADESSMDDVALYGSLLAARGRGAHVLFVGDINQLSPVGHGAPQRDSIAAGIPTGTLTEIRRNSGRIVQACAEIRDHRRFTCSPKIDLEAGENLGLITRATADDQIDALQATIDRFAKGNKYDPVWDVQVVCAVNKTSSPLNRKLLNRKLQDQLNPHGKRVEGNPFRVGDKVICLKNGSYRPVIEKEKGQKHYVANGEQGEVLTCDASRFVVRLQNPDREVIVLRSSKNSDDDQEARDPNDESAEESAGAGCDWDLGYAISVHKSQGSEWPVVIIMLDDSGAAKMVCTRNWLYTAISRAKVLGLLIGQEKTALEMCRRDGLRRKTFLAELIREGLAAAGVGAVSEDRAEQPEWTEAAFDEILEGVLV